ncbi:MAG: sulfatase [Myxococcota bacterium]
MDRTAWTPLVGWTAIVAAEAAVGRPLLAPPAAGPVAVELAAALALAGLHTAALRARPGSALALPELPAAAATLAWAAAAAAAHTAPVPGGGAPTSAGPASALLVALALAATLVAAALLPLHATPARPSVRAAAAAPLPALAAPLLAGWTDPSWHPSPATGPDAVAALALAVCVPLAAALFAALRPWLGPLAAAALAFLAARPPAPGGPPGPLVVLLTVDTLRTDAAADMATVRRLAARGETFADALSSSSWTVPALGSAMTGRWPADHGAGRPGRGWPGVVGLDPAVPVLAERLRAAGFRTGASVANAFLVPVMGFDRGFDAFRHADALPRAPLLVPWLAGRSAAGTPWRLHRDDGERVVDAALAWLDRGAGQPTFLWVHLLDPHLPYLHAVLPPEDPLYTVFGPVPDEALDAIAVRRGELRGDDTERDAVRALYRAEVAAADAALQRLLDGLDARGALDRATVLFTADHGEELWDHGGFEHGHALWPEVTRVPLVLVRPDGPRGARRADPASLVDVAPTLLAAAGVPAEGLAGVDLARPAPADRLRRLQGTLYFRQQQAVIRGDRALVEVDGEPLRLYDRAADPTWRHDLAGVDADGVDALAGELAPGWGHQAEPTGADLDLEALRALGYVQ